MTYSLRILTEPRKHDPDCFIVTAPATIAAYKAKWPKHCTRCSGVGHTVIYGTRYFPDGSGEPDCVELCDFCLGSNQCPRCGSPGVLRLELEAEGLDPVVPCPACGFRWGYDEGVPFRDGFACSCGADPDPYDLQFDE